jgi:hypothetical protein
MRRAVAVTLLTLFAAFGARDLNGDSKTTRRETVWAPTVIALKGTVRIRREGWKEWAPVQFGTAVHQGDVLDTEAGSLVQVICADLSRGTLSEGQTAGAPCKSNIGPIKTINGDVTGFRGDGGQPERDLILVSPRWTRIAEANPTIRWTAPPDVNRFQIAVRGGEINWTRTVESQRSLRYPADAPRLVPGYQYSVFVTAGARSSNRPGEPWPFFEIAPKVQIEAMERQLQVVRSLGLSSERTAVLEGKLLTSLGFHAAAIDRLEPVASRLGAAVTYRLLAGTYLETGLDHLAVETYRQALRKSAASGDSDGEAMAADALGSLCQRFRLCEEGEARTHLRKALAIYEALGAEEQVKRLRAQLAGLD